MSFATRTINLDISKDKIIDPINMIQGEIKARKIKINLYDNGLAIDLTACTMRAMILRPNETIAFYEDVTITSYPGGKAEYIISGEISEIVGKGVLQIEVIASGSPDPLAVMYTKEIVLYITAKRDWSGAIMASSAFTALQNALSLVGGHEARITAAEGGITLLNSTSAKLANAQTFTGDNTFAKSPIMPTPSGPTAGANKKFVEDSLASTSIDLATYKADAVTTLYTPNCIKKNNRVTINGAFVATISGATIMFTLPAGFRPPSGFIYSNATIAATYVGGLVKLSTSGDLTLATSATGSQTVYLNFSYDV